jgi:hypothetical protein
VHVEPRRARDEPRLLLQAKLKHARSLSNLSKAKGLLPPTLNNYHTIHAGGGAAWMQQQPPTPIMSSSEDTDVSDLDTDEELELRHAARPPSRRYVVRYARM